MTLSMVAGCAKERAHSLYPNRVTPEMQRAFNEAEQLSQLERFAEADQRFSLFVGQYPYTHLTDEALFRRGEIHFRDGDYEGAQLLYRQAVSQVYSPIIAPQALFKAALSLSRLERNREALELLRLIDRRHARALLRLRIDSLGVITSDRLEEETDRTTISWVLFLVDDYALLTHTPEVFEGMTEIVERKEVEERIHGWMENEEISVAEIETLPLEPYRGQLSGGYAFYRLAAAAAKFGDYDRSLEILKSYLVTYPTHPKASEARLLMSEVAGLVGEVDIKVGLIVPLTGKYRVYGESVLHGVECAIGVFTPCAGPNGVQLFIRDSKGEPETVRTAVDELAGLGVHVIIGPLTSNAVLEAATRAEELGVPLISLSQREGIAELGDGIFRNSVTPASQVNTLVSFVMAERAMRRFFILYPENRFGQEFKELFTERVLFLGGEIVGSKAYLPDQMNFAEQLRFRKIEGLTDQESASYDAIFIPDSPHAVSFLAPTLQLLGVKPVPLLGIDRWNAPELLQRGKEYLHGALFVGTFVKDSTDPETRLFIDRFQEAYGFSPTLLEALGYDSMRIILASVQEGRAMARPAIQAQLSRLTDFPGITGRITFDAEGNAERRLKLLTVAGGEIQEVREEE